MKKAAPAGSHSRTGNSGPEEDAGVQGQGLEAAQTPQSQRHHQREELKSKIA